MRRKKNPCVSMFELYTENGKRKRKNARMWGLFWKLEILHHQNYLQKSVNFNLQNFERFGLQRFLWNLAANHFFLRV